MVRWNLLSLIVCWVVAHSTVRVIAQSSLDNDGYAQLSPIDGTVVLNEFRASRIPGDFCLKFNIIHKPRRGESATPVSGTLWASWSDGGPRLRIEMNDNSTTKSTRFLTLKNTQGNHVWVGGENQPAQPIPIQTEGTVLAPGLILTAFDIQMPFTHWTDTHYEATERSRGRPVHFYLASNPRPSNVTKVKFGIDRSYRALTEATYYNAGGRILRVMQIEDFVKVDEQWMIGTCSVRDEDTRDVDTLKITEAAIHLKLSDELFNPHSLSQPTPLPSAEKFKPL